MNGALPYLRTALERIEQGTLAPALASLLEAWRASAGTPAIADAIDRLSDTLTRNEPLIRASGGTSAKEAWYAALRAKRPAGMGRVLEMLPEGADRAPRLRALLAEPPDPRIATFAQRWLETPPAGAKSRATFYLALAKLLDHTGDVRLARRLGELTRPSNEAAMVARYGRGTWGPFVALATTLAARPVPELTAEERDVLARIDAILQKPAPAHAAATSGDAETLFAAIYADPEDDEPRAVLADLLQQQSDPRGEFIAMQLARHGTDRAPAPEERKLERTWGRTWLGGMEPLVATDGVVFERGFVARCRYVARAGATAALDAPEWATVTHVDVGHSGRSPGPFLLSRAAGRIRRVHGLDVGEVAELRGAKALPWAELELRLPTWTHRGGLDDGPGELFARVSSLVLSATTRDGLFAPPREIAAFVSRWPNVRTFDIELGMVSALHSVNELVDDHVAELCVRTRASSARFVRATRSLLMEIHWVSEWEVATLRNLMSWMRPARADLVVQAPGTFDGERLRRLNGLARSAPLEDAAHREGIALFIQGAPVAAPL